MSTNQVNRAKWVQQIRQNKRLETYLRDIVDATLAEDQFQQKRKLRSRPLPPLQRSVLEQLMEILNDLQRASDEVSRALSTAADAIAEKFLDEAMHEWLSDPEAYIVKSDRIAEKIHRTLRAP